MIQVLRLSGLIRRTWPNLSRTPPVMVLSSFTQRITLRAEAMAAPVPSRDLRVDGPDACRDHSDGGLILTRELK